MVASPGSRDDRMVGRAGLTPFKNLERVTGIEPALSAWEAVRLRPSTWPDLRVGVSASDRERPLVAGANCTLMAQTRGAGFPRAGAGKILPRPRRTVGGEKAGRPEPYTGARGREPPRGPLSKCSSPWCSSSMCRSPLCDEASHICLGRLGRSLVCHLTWMDCLGGSRLR